MIATAEPGELALSDLSWLGIAFAWAFWLFMMILFLRYPGRVGGGALALYLFVAVGPWATWTVAAVTVVAALVWKVRSTPPVGLFGYPKLALGSVAGLLWMLGHAWLSVLGLAVLVAVVAWWLSGVVHSRRSDEDEGLPGAVVSPAPVGSALVHPAPWPESERRFLGGRTGWLIDFRPCERCGGMLVGSGRVEGDTATAVCGECGMRLMGVLNAEDGELVWFEVPEDWRREDIA